MDAGENLFGSDERLSPQVTELQEKTSLEVDPVGNIAISETNRTLRDTIDAGEGDLRNLILDLELSPMYGGSMPVRVDWFRDGIRLEQFSDSEMESHRWACTKCSRLRSHVWFDNESLTSLSYRKPNTGYPAAEPSPWVPASMRTEAAMDAPPCMEPEEQRKHRIYEAIKVFDMRNILASHPGEEVHPERLKLGLAEAQALGIPEVTALAQQPMYFEKQLRVCLRILDEFYKLDTELRGNRRRFRTCIECQLQLVHDSSRAHACGIAPYPPIVRSISMHFKTPLVRFFPEVATWRSQEPTPWPEYTGPQGEHVRGMLNAREWPDLQWPLYLIRCPECHTWQEQRAFRFTKPDMLYVPPTQAYDSDILSRTRRDIGVRLLLKDEVLCNHCFLKERGAAILEAELVAAFRDLVTQEIEMVRHTVYKNWQRFLRFTSQQSLPLVRLVYAHADPEIPRAYKLVEYPPRMTSSELESVTARRFYMFAVAVNQIMQSPLWFPLVQAPYIFWAATNRNFIEHWVWLEDVRARLDRGDDSLSESALARRGPCLT
ncbi:unnamed protein product [Clonostachys solani]|uniref:Uncharacterized protein n=1 Tax=Clonostachys solani TaxID=160281 RepID=A0A9N9YZS6_9HYPO|nr:unnamed protein product [Clonostachys solani]